MAARGVCITMAIINLVSIGGPIADLTEDDCNRESSKNLIYAGLVYRCLLRCAVCQLSAKVNLLPTILLCGQQSRAPS